MLFFSPIEYAEWFLKNERKDFSQNPGNLHYNIKSPAVTDLTVCVWEGNPALQYHSLLFTKECFSVSILALLKKHLSALKHKKHEFLHLIMIAGFALDIFLLLL